MRSIRLTNWQTCNQFLTILTNKGRYERYMSRTLRSNTEHASTCQLPSMKSVQCSVEGSRQLHSERAEVICAVWLFSCVWKQSDDISDCFLQREFSCGQCPVFISENGLKVVSEAVLYSNLLIKSRSSAALDTFLIIKIKYFWSQWGDKNLIMFYRLFNPSLTKLKMNTSNARAR